MKRDWILQKKEAIVERLELPGDICLGEMQIHLMGSRLARVENYGKLLAYEDTGIVMQGKRCKVSVEGRGLSIAYFTKEDMEIRGCIACVKYL
jgi:sporulation protein YqfC